ncbi:MAG: hypothetical protein KJN71_03660 [Acidimicrobiia bacterium]|nr:hypothetical protein [Acidimicrobiia bacterium]NNF65056.1 hypothetical protein [Acidimicrobiia bacterium]
MRDDGFTAVEWSLGIGLIVLPLLMVVTTLAPWFERGSMGRVMATETARQIVLSDNWADGAARGEAMAAQIAANHGFGSADWNCGPDCLSMTVLSVDSAGTPALLLGRGYEVTVTVNVPLPAISIPFIGDVLSISWPTSHTERVDDFRSFP